MTHPLLIILWVVVKTHINAIDHLIYARVYFDIESSKSGLEMTSNVATESMVPRLFGNSDKHNAKTDVSTQYASNGGYAVCSYFFEVETFMIA